MTISRVVACARRTAVRALLALAAAWTPAAAQEPAGRLVGRVVDAGQGVPVAGAVVELVGAPGQTTTALDGRYALAGVPAGEVAVRARMIGYQPKVITGVAVRAGEATTLEVALEPRTVELEEVVVTADFERGSVARALEEQRTAANIVSAITAEQIERSPDGDAGEAVRRVSGVTVQDGRYVFVRGLGERYTTTTLNGSRIPSPEPERKVVPLDLFPSGLLEGITTSKTFTADRPGDFSGAEVNLKTREFPAGRIVSLSASAGFNTAAGGDLPEAPTVGREWLGFAGDARDLPGGAAGARDLSGLSESDLNALIGSFRNAWSASEGPGGTNGSFGVSVGGEDPLLGQPVGYLASFTYSVGRDVRKDERRALAVDGGNGTTRAQNVYSGASAGTSVLWGGLLNLSTRLGATGKLSLNNSYTRSADNGAVRLAGYNEEFARPFEITRLTFTERAVRSSQLTGEHLLGERHVLTWSGTASRVDRNEPDRSDLVYEAAVDPATGASRPVAWFGAPRSATRTFSTLDERSLQGTADYRLTLGRAGSPTYVKVGVDVRSTDRDADSRAFDILNRSLDQAELAQDPERIFDGAYAAQGRLFLTANANLGRYTAEDRVTAGYAQVELPLASRLRLIAGARVERWALDLETRRTDGAVVTSARRNTDVLPSVTLNVALSETQTLRLSASQTLSRPEYREISPVASFDVLGGLTLRGNPNLRRALVQNYDARWEWYPRAGEVLSLGVFAKRFDSPIERVLVATTGADELGFVNADGADNYGVEAEVRKHLDGLSPALAGFTAFANATLMRSRIRPGNEDVSSLTSADRPMVGQASYVVNAGLGYTSASGRFSATALYNVVGRRIAEAAHQPLPDAYEEARHLLDLTVQLPLFESASLRLDAENLLDAPYEITQGEVTRLRYRTGRVFSAGVSWTP